MFIPARAFCSIARVAHGLSNTAQQPEWIEDVNEHAAAREHDHAQDAIAERPPAGARLRLQNDANNQGEDHEGAAGHIRPVLDDVSVRLRDNASDGEQDAKDRRQNEFREVFTRQRDATGVHGSVDQDDRFVPGEAFLERRDNRKEWFFPALLRQEFLVRFLTFWYITNIRNDIFAKEVDGTDLVK